MQRGKNSQPCMYFLQGRCRFGQKCKFSHQGYDQALMIRHAQSLFNMQVDTYKGDGFATNPIPDFQLNPNNIDCWLSQQGVYQCRHVQLPKQYYRAEIDIVFVSPLNRCLHTAMELVNSRQSKFKRVIVLPQLSQVLSKICDLSSSWQQKKQRFPKFDFREVARFVKQRKLQREQDWQDEFVDQQYWDMIDQTKQYAGRYLRLLQEIFPTPLESSDRCFDRAMRALDIIKQIIQHYKAKKILIVSHNRILKYMDGRFNKGRANSFQNCQIRKIVF